MAWEDIIKQTDEYQEPSEEEQLKERVDEFYEDIGDEIEYKLSDLTHVFYKFENELRKQKTWMSVLTEPKMSKFYNKFFDGVNLLREAQTIAEGED